jgi:hypothetical protein
MDEGRRGTSLKNILFLIKVFTITESSGHFISIYTNFFQRSVWLDGAFFGEVVVIVLTG